MRFRGSKQSGASVELGDGVAESAPAAPVDAQQEADAAPSENNELTDRDDHASDGSVVGIEFVDGADRPSVEEQHFKPLVAAGPPDVSADGFSVGEVTVRAASVRGLSHRYYGDPRQDSYVVEHDRTSHWSFAAVADGLGSASRSHRGSQLAARSALKACRERVGSGESEIDWPFVFEKANASLRAIAEQTHDRTTPTGETVDEIADSLSTTLAVLAVAPAAPPDAHLRCSIGLVGDSGAWLLRDGTWYPITSAKESSDELAHSTTDALPVGGTIEPVVASADLRAGDAVFLMTDGVGDLLGSGRTQVAAHLAARWTTPPAPAQFVAEVDVRVRSFDDDRTAVGFWLSATGTTDTEPADEAPTAASDELSLDAEP